MNGTSAANVWLELLELARWAPSPHNIQPWRLRPRSDHEASLLVDGRRLLPDTDPTGRFTEVGMGIFVESLAVAAAARGLALDAAYSNESLRPRDGAIPFAELRLRPERVDERLAPELLTRRRTSRLPYDGRPAPERVLEELGDLSAHAGHTFAWSSDPELVAWTLDLNRDTLFYDLTDPRARAEIGCWLRFGARAAARARDGFSPAALGFPGWLLWLFFRLHGLLARPGPRHVVHRLYDRTMAGTGTVAWLTGPFSSSPEWTAAGRMLARLWLTLEREGLHLHPFGSIVTNPRANERLQRRLGRADSEATLWLIMRIGASAPPPRSLRLGTDELVVA